MVCSEIALTTIFMLLRNHETAGTSFGLIKKKKKKKKRFWGFYSCSQGQVMAGLRIEMGLECSNYPKLIKRWSISDENELFKPFSRRENYPQRIKNDWYRPKMSFFQKSETAKLLKKPHSKWAKTFLGKKKIFDFWGIFRFLGVTGRGPEFWMKIFFFF